MDYRKLLLPLFLLMVMTSAYATITVTVTEPAASAAYTPNLRSEDKCILLDFNVLDDNGLNSTHIVNASYLVGDTNAYIITDRNITETTCDFAVSDSYDFSTLGGARCIQEYCWTSYKPPTGPYVLDANVVAYDATGGDPTDIAREQGHGIVNFTIDNRYITTSVESLLGVVPLVLVAAVLIVIALGLLGYVSPRIVIVLLPSLIIVLIALIIINAIVATMVANVGPG